MGQEVTAKVTITINYTPDGPPGDPRMSAGLEGAFQGRETGLSPDGVLQDSLSGRGGGFTGGTSQVGRETRIHLTPLPLYFLSSRTDEP